MNTASSPTLIQALQDPGRYSEAPAAIDMLQTHMSWILLAGPHVYKIKKPVNLGFADFTSLRSRHHYCLEELRLNRRLAPHLSVVPISGTPDAPALGDPRHPFEYAVKMKRFPQDALLSRVLARGALTRRHLDQLAADIAAFHDQVAVAPATSSCRSALPSRRCGSEWPRAPRDGGTRRMPTCTCSHSKSRPRTH